MCFNKVAQEELSDNLSNSYNQSNGPFYEMCGVMLCSMSKEGNLVG